MFLIKFDTLIGKVTFHSEKNNHLHFESPSPYVNNCTISWHLTRDQVPGLLYRSLQSFNIVVARQINPFLQICSYCLDQWVYIRGNLGGQSTGAQNSGMFEFSYATLTLAVWGLDHLPLPQFPFWWRSKHPGLLSWLSWTSGGSFVTICCKTLTLNSFLAFSKGLALRINWVKSPFRSFMVKNYLKTEFDL